MGIEYELISRRARVSYELGKGPWRHQDVSAALGLTNPFPALVAFLRGEHGYPDQPEYCAQIAGEICAFVAANPDWLILDEDESWLLQDDEGAPFVTVGSRYR